MLTKLNKKISLTKSVVKKFHDTIFISYEVYFGTIAGTVQLDKESIKMSTQSGTEISDPETLNSKIISNFIAEDIEQTHWGILYHSQKHKLPTLNDDDFDNYRMLAFNKEEQSINDYHDLQNEMRFQ